MMNIYKEKEKLFNSLLEERNKYIEILNILTKNIWISDYFKS